MKTRVARPPYQVGCSCQTTKALSLSRAPYTPNANPKLCLVRHLDNYIKKTDKHRVSRDSLLFISYAKPFGPVSRNTFSRWVKAVLAEAGIDTGRYSGHSTRAAACSALAERASLDTVLKATGWRSESTFAKFFKKDKQSAQNFDQVLLDRYLKK